MKKDAIKQIFSVMQMYSDQLVFTYIETRTHRHYHKIPPLPPANPRP